MLIGYARVSTADQTIALQRDALKKVGCGKIFRDQGKSGIATTRPDLDRALRALREGDSFVVWILDRLGGSLCHLVQTITDLWQPGVGFQSLSDSIDNTKAGGRLVLHMMGALAEFERALIVERTQAGLRAAKQLGVKLGRKPTLTPAQVAHARRLNDGGESPRTVANTLGIGRTTLWRALKFAA
jgi:DNA invertase Pin-like site-specific DNA recombinase